LGGAEDAEFCAASVAVIAKATAVTAKRDFMRILVVPRGSGDSALCNSAMAEVK